MRQLELIHKIIEQFSVFVAQIKGASSINLYDINILSEYMLIPLFKEIFQLSALRNVNDDDKNYPGIDLADDENRVAFQITSTATSSKLNQTLNQFFKHELDKKYDRLYFYILTEKQSSYTIKRDILNQSNFDFSPSRDILDSISLIKKIQGLDLNSIENVHSILENQFSIHQRLSSFTINNESANQSNAHDIESETSEKLYSNLLEITFPNKLYIAYLNIDRKNVIKSSRVDGGGYLKNSASARDIVRESLNQKRMKFANDWTCHENKLITFHDLNDNLIPLREIVDEGTIEEFEPEEFYLIDKDHENVFKGLLHYCLMRYLYQKNIEWKHEDRLFVFMPEYGEPKKRQIRWFSKVNATRTVFDLYFNPKTDKISYCKHLAFETHYRRYDNRWFIEIIPHWYITSNGFKKSYYASEKIKWLKRNERNQHVFNHLKFIASYIKEKEQLSLFDDGKQFFPGFITFKQLLSTCGHPRINDIEWNWDEEKEKKKSLNDSQQSLPCEFLY